MEIHWVPWEKVITDKKLGSLGVGSLKALNTSLIVKHMWRLRVEQRALWVNVIKGIHNIQNKPNEYYSKKTMTGTWKNITGAKKNLEKKGVSTD